ncbi:MAG TPA: hypothetical protein VGB17_18205 [Pyrinomonadaceae bacterium]|jgi:hypothetical protein
MKRAQDKIKDYVEPQSFDEVANFASDPARALAAYRFTDATSELIVRWLDALADLSRNRGTCRALAGQRGVGKSHTLAAIGALAAIPELRLKVSDAHVTTSARRLLSRAYTVVRVERGTRSTLEDEISAAFAQSFGGQEADWKHEPAILLTIAAHKSNGPFILLVDTATGREVRVRRNDGPLLSQLAAATAEANAFVGIALDDDIEGADGANVALSGAFHIDYLDPEHLYRITDLHLFPKKDQARTALQEIYTNLRATVPGFNWSEPRFAAVYPVHPLIADVAAAVRLYAPAFAFLPFAAAAGVRAANRPALSLVVLDEVFDRAEYDLRKAEDLRHAFTAYDELGSRAVTKFPINQRLQAKLVLKGLFILSLDGRGATAQELCAAMLFYEETQPARMVERVEEMLARLMEAAPTGSLRRNEDKSEFRYCFDIKKSSEFEGALAISAQRVSASDASIRELLHNIARARFTDWPLTNEQGQTITAAVDFSLPWRGTPRPGSISLQAYNQEEAFEASASSQDESSLYDWKVITLAPLQPDDCAQQQDNAQQDVAGPTRTTGPAQTTGPAGAALPVRAVWRPAPLSAEEMETLCRLIALWTDRELLTNFRDAAWAAEQSHKALAERIWARIYLDDGLFLIDGAERLLTDEARAAATLAETLALTLAPSFEARYAQHPVFHEVFAEDDVAQLVGGLFSGANQAEARVQQLAQSLGLPLGLASLRGGSYALEADDQMLKLPWVREVLALTEQADGETVPLACVYEKLRREPYGLLREAQQLILAALVAQRRIELVTQAGDRISRRTLDRELRWDEVAGVARIATILHSADELTGWARALTDQEQLASIARPEAREAVREALDNWLKGWRAKHLLEQFDALPDEGLTTRAWNLSSAVRKSFGVAAEAIEAVLAENISLEEGLQRVADAFGDSLNQLRRNESRLAELECFTAALPERERVRAFLMMTEPTSVELIESMRRELQALADDVHSLFEEQSVRRFELLWREFHGQYIEHYASLHDEVMHSSAGRRVIDDLTRADEWRDFEMRSQLSIVSRRYWEEATRLLAWSRKLRCELPVRQILLHRPVCGCGFRLSRLNELGNIPQRLQTLMESARLAHLRTLSLWSAPLAHTLEVFAQHEGDAALAERARMLIAALAEGCATRLLSPSDLHLIENALKQTALPPLRVSLPVEGQTLLTREELGTKFKQWLNELPGYPAFVEIISGNEASGG